LLAEALRAAGKDRQVELCRWIDDFEALPSIYDDEPDYRPTSERPLVYHLFGSIDEPDSIVLTEDNYFDYLIGVKQNKDLLPVQVRMALYASALMFIGYEVDDFSFRMLFKSLMGQEGGGRRTRYSRAIQCEPQDTDRMQHYLEARYQDADIEIYWGSVEDFVLELQRRMDDGDKNIKRKT
jgi:hypothetical protein